MVLDSNWPPNRTCSLIVYCGDPRYTRLVVSCGRGFFGS